MRISNSFSEDEINVLDSIARAVMADGRGVTVGGSPAFSSLCRKIFAMKAKAMEKRAEAEAEVVVAVPKVVAEVAAPPPPAE